MVSLIIPAWNGAAHIAQAIASAKSNGCGEIVVVDDASPDDCGKIAAELGCKVVRHDVNRRQIEAKNTGLRNSLGEFVMFLDQDDVLAEGAISMLLAELHANPGISVVQAQADDFISGGVTGVKLRKGYFGQISGAMLFRKSVFDIIGLFDLPADVYTGEWMWLQDQFKKFSIAIKKVDMVSVFRRIHSENFGILHRDEEFRNYAAILRKRLKDGF